VLKPNCRQLQLPDSQFKFSGERLDGGAPVGISAGEHGTVTGVRVSETDGKRRLIQSPTPATLAIAAVPVQLSFSPPLSRAVVDTGVVHDDVAISLGRDLSWMQNQIRFV
jgi:hypothetical protein